MAISEYDDPRWNPPVLDPNKPTFGAVGHANLPTTFDQPRGPQNTEQGGGGGIPGLSWLVHHVANLFHHGSTPTPTTTAPKPTTTAPKSTTQNFVDMAPELIQLILALRANSQQNNPANNPALASLNASVPQLTAQLNALLQNDVRRRQQSDPLYEAVLRGAMGGLPVWMRGSFGGLTGGAGGGLSGPVVPPRMPTSGVPTTPGTDIFRDQGNDPGGMGYPNG